MIEYNDYEKINKYLDNNEFDKIREYIEKEYKKTNLMLAKKAVSKYFDTYRSCIYEYVDGKLLISDSISLYLLNSDELLSDYRKKRLNDPKHKVDRDKVTFAYDAYSLALTSKRLNVKAINKIYLSNGSSKAYEISSEDNNTTYYFNIENFNVSKKILGDDVKYTLCTDKCICVAESEKGKGLILGIKVS